MSGEVVLGKERFGEACECGGAAIFIKFGQIDGWKIPILKCNNCKDSFDANEEAWVKI